MIDPVGDDAAALATLDRHIDRLLAGNDPSQVEPTVFWQRAVRRGPGLGALPRGPRRPGPAAAPPAGHRPRGCGRRARRASTEAAASAGSSPAPPSSATAATSCRTACSAAPSRARTSGASSSASPQPVPTWRHSRPARSATATSGSSRARRSGTRSLTSPTSRAPDGAHRPARAEAQRHHLLRPRHARSRGRVRPLRQITGDAEFNEVFLTEVRMPDADRIGEVGEGWRVSMNTLANERSSIGGGTRAPPHGSGPIAEAVRLWSSGADDRPAVHNRLMRRWCEAEALRLTNLRAMHNPRPGTRAWKDPSPS